MFLISGSQVQKDPDLVANTLLSTLKKHGCEVLRNERWNERKLAYPVKRCDKGTYFVIHFNADEKRIAALRRDCQLSELILRTMITVCPVPLEKLPPVGTGPREEMEPRKTQEQVAPASAQSREPGGRPEVASIDAFNIEETSPKPRKGEDTRPQRKIRDNQAQLERE
jgi:small subunit ribosomal protein S6